MSVPSTITFDSLANSNMPPAQKSAIRRWYDSSMGPGGGNKVALAKLHVKAAGEAIRAGGESLLVGGALGALHQKSATGLDIKKVPVDAAAGAVLLLAGVLGAQEEVGKDLANAGAACMAVFAFRKTHDLLAEAALKSSGFTPGGGAAQPFGTTTIGKVNAAGVAIHGERRPWGSFAGDFGSEPLVQAARGL